MSAYHPYGESFRDWAEIIKGRYSISSIIGETVRLRGRNGIFMGHCPFHNDSTPSLSVDDNKGLFHCFGCGAGGDVIAYVQRMEGLSAWDAVVRLDQGDRVITKKPSIPWDDEAERIKAAKDMWAASEVIDGSPAALYLESRALPVDFVEMQENIRFARNSFDGSAKKHPMLIAAARDVHGEVVAVQRIFLKEDGSKVDKNCKRTLGRGKGAAIRLAGENASVEAAEHIVICEGLEDGLSFARYYPASLVWVTMGTANMVNLVLPESCRQVTIAHDNDDPGRRVASQMSEELVKRGYDVYLAPPPEDFKDWNEFLSYWDRDHPEMAGNPLPWRYWSEDDFYDVNGDLKVGIRFPAELRQDAC